MSPRRSRDGQFCIMHSHVDSDLPGRRADVFGSRHDLMIGDDRWLASFAVSVALPLVRVVEVLGRLGPCASLEAPARTHVLLLSSATLNVTRDLLETRSTAWSRAGSTDDELCP